MSRPQKTVYAPHLKREVRVNGCHVDQLHARHALAMKHVLHAKAAAITVPATTTFTQPPSLQSLLTQMFLNNLLGDCVIAARARRTGLLTGWATGSPFLYTDAMLDTEYGRIGGYVVGNPATDNGCDPTVSADDGVKVGYANGGKDAGWVAVDASNRSEAMLANYITNGACDLSMALPDAWINAQMPQKNGDVWDVAGDPNPENGHNVAVVDHGTNGLVIDTWGLLVTVTWAAAAKYGIQSNGGMLIAHVNHDAILKSTSVAADGFDWSTMLTLFDQDLGADVPLPPPPGPGPTPTSGVTLDQAQAMVTAGLAHAPALMSRRSATKYANAALAAGWPKS